ncbi:helix-turn-helix transcriptional regulator [Streptomyces sp. CSDS2]|uniref:helix-turn-helix domain-containing protein n=1 Tax=Streptomyces sp. CSDS2 TaxID=3055051 RepID=UPI0025B1F74F|nr:helix-turn-helix transcriptional regulator [Streptomyces sp. CSDS2]MDN3260812.1 helix-turn-helix transcriptional regulator [Streptomyces sp. CSDS2]
MPALVLGALLRYHRERAGMSPAAAGAVIRKSASTISRLECAHVPARRHDVLDLAQAYGLRGHALDEAEELLDHGHQHLLAGLYGPPHAVLSVLKARATHLRILTTFELPTVAGPAAGTTHPAPAATPDRTVSRPQADYRDVTLLVEDTVLRRPRGGYAAAAARLRQTIDLAEHGAWTVRIVPHERRTCPVGPLISELVLPQGRVYVHEGYLPVYRTGRPAAPYRTALDAAADAALNREASLQALRQAARAFSLREAA